MLDRLAGHHLLLIGAYRDNEVTPAHPLLVTVAGVRQAGAHVRDVRLAPLERSHVVEFVVDTLQCGPNEVEALADVCLHKTRGNPFFLGQFLLSLQARGALRYVPHEGRWRWEDAELARMDITDNVVDLMAGRILALAEPVQHTLRVAACLGNLFSLRTLATSLGVSPAQAAAALWPALEEGLLLPLDSDWRFAADREAGTEAREGGPPPDVSYRFLHDRVQQAAYSLIPAPELGALHLQVGQRLWRGLREDEREEQLFALVGHLNLGSALLGTQEERDELAALNLTAARKAQSSTAYPAARSLLEQAIALLGEHGFERRHALAIALHLQSAEVSFLNKEFDRIDTYARQVLANDGDVLLRVKVAEIHIQAFNAQNKFRQAVHTALEILAVLGVRFPEEPTLEDFLANERRLDEVIAGRPIESLLELPELVEPVKIAVLRILAMAIPSAYLGDPRLMRLLTVRQVIYSIEHGNAAPSATGYSALSIILCGALGRIDEGYDFGLLASRVLARYDAKTYEARTKYMVSCYITHTKEHVHQSVRAFKDIYRTALETGDIDFAGYSLVSEATQRYLGGEELPQLEKLTADSLHALTQLQHEPSLNYTRAVHQVVLNLMDRSDDPCVLVGPGYDEAALIRVHGDSHDSYGLGSLYLWKLQLCFLFGRCAEALAHADALRPHMPGLVAQFQVPTAWLFDALAALSNCEDASPEERARLLARVEEDLQSLEFSARHAPMNHAHKVCLVRAERARVVGEPERAREQYYRAMALAREHDYRQEEALATELFSHFMASRGEHEVADLFLAKARHLYELWGARAKVSQLERDFPALVAQAQVKPGGRWSARDTTTLDEFDGADSALDLVSVLKASQALSGEVLLSGLLEKLMHIVLENAGARRGLLVLEGDAPLVVVADARSGPVSVVLEQAPLEQREDVPLSLVRYVQRTHEVRVLEDAAHAGDFVSDPYVVKHRSKSLLCLPILQQKKLVGVLLLENDLVARAFSSQRRQVLELLSAQAAISLQNAKLYDTLESRVARRTQELSTALERLRDTQRQLVMQEKLASLGILTSGIAHELKNPLNFVNNFASLSVQFGEELLEGLEAQRERLEPGPYAALDELVRDMKRNAVKIHEHGTRADGIVRAMLQHASPKSQEPRGPVVINDLVHQYVELAVAGRGGRVRRGWCWSSTTTRRWGRRSGWRTSWAASSSTWWRTPCTPCGPAAHARTRRMSPG